MITVDNSCKNTINTQEDLTTLFLKNTSKLSMTKQINTAEKGLRGEQIATEYLKEKGYQVILRNYRFKRSEIDLIALKQDILVFVEVKFHQDKGYGFPEEAVSLAQQARVAHAAEHYIFESNWQGDIRFDIIAIQTNEEANFFDVQHFEDAFY